MKRRGERGPEDWRRWDVDDGSCEPRSFVGRHRVQAVVGTVVFTAAAVSGWALVVGDGAVWAVTLGLPAVAIAVAFAGEWRRPSSLTLDRTGWTNRSVVLGTLHGRWDRCGPFQVRGNQVVCATASLEPPVDRRSRLHRWVCSGEVALPRGDVSFNGGPVEMRAEDLARMLNRYRDHYRDGRGGPSR